MAASLNLQKTLADAGLTVTELRTRLIDAQDFHARLLDATKVAQGLEVNKTPEWAQKLIRRSESVAHAVVGKLGSNIIAKRRPDETQDFLDYITRCMDAGAPLNLRVVFGPVKNVRRFGSYQVADMAEYLTLIQLGRVAENIAALYPHGVRIELVPDDKRGSIANAWPMAYSRQYIASLKRMVTELQFDAWMQVEDGQARLYERYDVSAHTHAAMVAVMADEQFAAKLEKARYHARENLFSQSELTEHEVQDSAMRYLIAHKAECLSGMWSPIDALPLVFANHPDNFQLYTLGRGLTKLPWQVCLPFAALSMPQEASVAPLPAIPAMPFMYAS